jgi:hypothetical protein
MRLWPQAAGGQKKTRRTGWLFLFHLKEVKIRREKDLQGFVWRVFLLGTKLPTILKIQATGHGPLVGRTPGEQGGCCFIFLFLVSWRLPTLHACQFVLYVYTHSPLPPSLSSVYYNCDLWFGLSTKLSTIAAINVLIFKEFVFFRFPLLGKH